MTRHALIVGCLFVPGCPSSTAPEPDEPGVVTLEQGRVRGVIEGPLTVFKGIPYAAPPVGDSRWRPPKPGLAWDGVLEATAFGRRCPQPLIGAEDEDCLTLNVWTPDVSVEARLPVLFYIHGGSYIGGGASDDAAGVDLHDGSYLAETGPAVVVTINYRIGAFGFMAHPALSAESGYGGSGNYGFMDQIEALRWVQTNIGRLGGDPDRVLIFGVSAGGGSASVLLASPEARGLFSSAILESSSGFTYDLASQEAQGNRLAQALGCTDPANALACMRAKSTSAIETALDPTIIVGAGNVLFGPVHDGFVLPEPLITMFREGTHNHVPVVIGTTADEFSWFIEGYFPAGIASDADYRAAVETTWGPSLAPIILERYPSSASPREALVAVFGDAIYHCDARRLSRALAASQSEPVRRYVYAHTFRDPTMAPFRAGHTFDDQMVFHNFAMYYFEKPFVVAPDELALASTMSRYWTQLAATGDPNAPGEATWTVYEPATDGHLVLDTPIRHGTNFRPAECELWDAILD